MKRYISLFNENKIPEEILKKFGFELFGSFLDKKEKDTQYESEIFKSLEYWIKGEFMGKSSKGNINKIFNELKKIKELYPYILKPETNILYRLITVKMSFISNLLPDIKLKNKRFKFKCNPF